MELQHLPVLALVLALIGSPVGAQDLGYDNLNQTSRTRAITVKTIQINPTKGYFQGDAAYKGAPVGPWGSGKKFTTYYPQSKGSAVVNINPQQSSQTDQYGQPVFGTYTQDGIASGANYNVNGNLMYGQSQDGLAGPQGGIIPTSYSDSSGSGVAAPGPFDSNDPFAGLDEQSLFGDLTSWLPTLEERMKLLSDPEELAKYEQKLNAYRQQMLEKLSQAQQTEQQRRATEDQTTTIERQKEDMDLQNQIQQLNQNHQMELEQLRMQQQQLAIKRQGEDAQLNAQSEAMDPAQLIQQRGQLALQRVREDQAYKEQQRQKTSQLLAQQQRLEALQSTLRAQRQLADEQRQMQRLAWDVQYKLAQATVQNAKVRGTVHKPDFAQMPKQYVSEGYRKQVDEWRNVWLQQRQQETTRIRELTTGRKTVATKDNQTRIISHRANFDQRRVVVEQQKVTEQQRVQDDMARAQDQIDLKQQEMTIARQVEDAQFQAWQQQVISHGYNVNVEQVNAYLEQKRIARQQEDLQMTQSRSEITLAQQQADLQRQQHFQKLDQQLVVEQQEVDMAIQQETLQFQQAITNADTQLQQYETARQQEEAQAQTDYQEWVQLQNGLQSEVSQWSLSSPR